jgi:hypothetical protein
VRCSAIQASADGCLELPRGEPVLGRIRRQARAEEPVPDRDPAGYVDGLGIRATAHAGSLRRATRHLEERLRAEIIAGLEAEWRKQTGRPMTAEALDRVLRRYPGDI